MITKMSFAKVKTSFEITIIKINFQRIPSVEVHSEVRSPQVQSSLPDTNIFASDIPWQVKSPRSVWCSQESLT